MSQNKSAQNSEQNSPSLSYLFGLDTPRFSTHYHPNGSDVSFILEGDQRDLDRILSAASNSRETLRDGIEAITDLLLIVEMHNTGEAMPCTKTSALYLLIELGKMLAHTHELEWKLDRATPEENDGHKKTD